MASKDMAAAIRELVRPQAEALGLEVWGVDYAVMGRKPLVRIYIDTPGRKAGGEALDAKAHAEGQELATGPTIEACARISRSLSVALDVEDLLPSAYTLEVSSPGLDRIFFESTQLCGYIGYDFEITLRAPSVAEFPGRRRFKGRLQAVEGTQFTLLVDTIPVIMDWTQVKRARLAPFASESADSASDNKKAARKKKSKV